MTRKQQLYADYVAQGMSKKDAALKAGFSLTCANSAKQAIETKEGYQMYLASKVPVTTALDVLSEQLEATRMAGVIGIKPIIMPDNQARLKATEMALKLHGKFELDNTQSAPKTLIMVHRNPDCNPTVIQQD